LVVAQDEARDAAWAAYAQVFPSPAIQDAASALLEPAAKEDKKRKATDPPSAQEDEISLSSASTSVPLRLPKRSRIGEVKQAVGTVRASGVLR
jgi:hypothetical protein